MKKLLFLIGAMLILSNAFAQTENKKALATANKVDGYYIFVQSKPVSSYEILGTVKKTGIVMSGDPKEMFETLIRRMKKEFPKSDGIIFDDVAMEHATCIVFN